MKVNADPETIVEGAVTAVGLVRGMCFGPCPAYRVTVSVEGHVTYEGKAWVERLGSHEGEVDPVQVRRLVGSILRLGFTRLEPEYEAPHTCMSTDELVLWAGSRSSRVIDHGGAPAALRKMIALVEAVVDGVHWERPVDVGERS
jgi:hypothetical protein